MKKFYIYTILWIIFTLSFTNGYSALNTTDFSEYINSDQPKVNLYFTLKDYYLNNINKQDQEALKQTAEDFSTTPKTIKQIISGTLKSCEELSKNFFGCQELTIECLQKCYTEVSKVYTINLQKKMGEQIIKSTLIGENNLNDGIEDNGPYDLLVDIGKISKILFKEQVEEETTSYGKVNMKQVNIKSTIFGKNDNIDDILQQFKTIDNLENELVIQNNNSNVVNNTIQQNSLTNQTNVQSVNIQTQTNSSTPSHTNTLNKNPENPIFPNLNFHIGNVCKINNTESNSYTNTSTDANIGNAISNTNIVDNSGNNTGNNDLETNGNNSNVKPNTETLNTSSLNIFDSNQNKLTLDSQNLSNQNNKNIEESLLKGMPGCQQDSKKLLTVCIQFIPSGPRGPVGGTTRVNSIQDVIQKISDTLKDIRQSFIIPSSHGDEALDIDYKHIKLDKIISFNIVLTSKPVFRFKNNFIGENGKPDKGNEPDTQNCEDMPRYLANLYTTFGIVNCNSTKADISKYLFTNFENVKLPKWDFSEGENGLNNTTSTEGQKSTASQIGEFITLTTSFFENISHLLKDWQLAATVLKVKSE